jgi:hypothetical protein
MEVMEGQQLSDFLDELTMPVDPMEQARMIMGR